jgi:hypothetical protein
MASFRRVKVSSSPAPCSVSAWMITTLRVYLAKSVFQVCVLDQHGRVVLKKQFTRDLMVMFLRGCRLAMASVRLGTWPPS